MPLVLDIETLPLQSALTAPYDPDQFSPPANYKSTEAVMNWHQRNEATWRVNRQKECSLHPRLGRIVCVGSSDGLWYAETEEQERGLLRDAWLAIARHEGRVVTWNGQAFDLRFLVVRSMFCGVVPTIGASSIRSWFKRYDVFQHFDVAQVCWNWNRPEKGDGLDEWAKAFGLPGKPEGIDGSSVSWLHAEGQHDTIKEYCMGDAKTTEALYHKLVPYFGGDR